MKKIYWLFLAGFLFASCSKEKSFEQKVENPVDTTDNPSGGLLVKMVGKAEGASDSAIVTYSYNAAGKVVNIFSTTVGLVDNQYVESEVRYSRNDDGMITRYVYVEKIRQNGTILFNDSIVYTLHISASHYTYAIRAVRGELDNILLDSIVYSYDNKDRINSVVALRKDEDHGIPLFDLQKTIYTYDPKGNIALMSIAFKNDVNTNDPAQLISFSYGDKLSPINLGSDGLLDGLISHGVSSPNNLLIMDNPDMPQKLSYTYEFNAASKPVKAVETDLATGIKTNIHYYYK